MKNHYYLFVLLTISIFFTQCKEEDEVTGTPKLKYTPESYNFDKVEVGTTKTIDFTLENEGTANLIVKDFNVYYDTNEFKIKNLSKNTLIPPGKVHSFQVEFSPTQAKKLFLTIEIITNDGDIKLNVEGEGAITETFTKIVFKKSILPFENAGDEFILNDIKVHIPKNKSDSYVTITDKHSAFGSFGWNGEYLAIWPGRVELDLSKKPTIKSIDATVAGNAVPFIIFLYDANGNQIYEQELNYSSGNFQNPQPRTINYTAMKDVKYLTALCYEGYLVSIKFNYNK